MLEEAVLKEFVDFHAWLGSYGIEIHEKCIGDKNKFNGGSGIVSSHRREEGGNGVIVVLVRTAVRETIVRLYHQYKLIETTKLGGSL